MSGMVRVSLIGVGKMGEAFLAGLVRSGYDLGLLMIYDVDSARAEEVAERHRVKRANSLAEATSWGEVTILAVKPKDVNAVLLQLVGRVGGKTLVSFAAGVGAEHISKVLGEATTVIRAMPNLACRVRQGVIAVAKNPSASSEAYQTAIGILGRTGEVFEVDEVFIDVVTGLTGSGPAYVCYFMEALADAGSKLGLDGKISRKMVLQLVYGTSRLLLEEKIPTESLRAMVTTPGGTTARGLEVLSECNFRECLVKAIEMATQRAREIARELEGV